jgi:hypothetical protein
MIGKPGTRYDLRPPPLGAHEAHLAAAKAHSQAQVSHQSHARTYVDPRGGAPSHAMTEAALAASKAAADDDPALKKELDEAELASLEALYVSQPPSSKHTGQGGRGMERGGGPKAQDAHHRAADAHGVAARIHRDKAYAGVTLFTVGKPMKRILQLTVKPSPIHGVGTFSRVAFPAGTTIGPVRGTRLARPYGSHTCVVLSDTEMLEPDDTGVPIHKMNHHRPPNCEMRWNAQRQLDVVTLVAIAAGTELTIDYQWTPAYFRSQGIHV